MAVKSAAPGTVDESAKKVERKAYREEGAKTLTAIPTDWDPKVHHGLKRQDFAEEAQHLHFTWMADRTQLRVDDLRGKAKEWKETGGLRKQKRENQYKALLAKIATLEGELAGSGVDLNALKASLKTG